MQMALAHAEHPEQPAPTLKRERIACGVDDPDLDVMVARARREGKLCRAWRLAAPRAHRGRHARDGRADPRRKAADFAARLDQLLAAMPAAENDLCRSGRHIRHDAGGPRPRRQPASLVMDLHKRLNAMQAALAEENLTAPPPIISPKPTARWCRRSWRTQSHR
ncbi:conserved protein of unknown function (plasmid) [Methylocella tundrae]|uniref:Uncharacterized protein n=1 Tax=Methylocella tundrae TaxID=227605 RepID=A0A4V6IN66_METTU|nr:conserved protein of unknown function [Methylocella tundrae]